MSARTREDTREDTRDGERATAVPETSALSESGQEDQDDGAAPLEPEVLEADALPPEENEAERNENEAESEETTSESRLSETSVPTVHRAGEYGPVSALTRYMAELRHHAPISREEEHELAVRWVEQGDVEAARRLVLANLRLVVKIAMEYRRAWTNTLDLVQEGNVGLMEAVQRYDPYLGVKLSSYAVYWIRAYILKYILDNMRSVRMGTTRAQRKLFFRLNKEKRQLELEGYEVEPRLLAERLDVSEDDVVGMETLLSHPDLSMDAPARRDDDSGVTVGDRMAGRSASAEQNVADEEMRRAFLERVEQFAEKLSERETRILRDRLLASEPMTLADLGKEFGVSRERVRQLEARLLKQLRSFMEENMVDFQYYVPPEHDA